MNGPGATASAAGRAADSRALASSGIRFSLSLERLRRPLPAFLALTDQGVTSIASFLAGILVARAVSPGAFGIYTLVGVATIWAIGAQSALVTTPYIYQQGRCAPARRPAYTGSTLLHHWLLCGSVAFAMAPLVALFMVRTAPAELVGPIGIFAVGVLVKEYLRTTYYAHRRFGRALTLNAATAVMQMGGLAALWMTGHLSVVSALLVMGLPPLCVAIPLQIARARQSTFDLRDSLRQLRVSWSFGKWLLGGIAVSAFSRDAFPWVLAALRGVATTGRYAVHLNIALLVNPAVIAVANYLAPSFAGTMQKKGLPALRRRAYSTALVIGGPMLLYSTLLLFFSGALSAAIYGAGLRASNPVVALIALGLSVTAFSIPYGIALFALGRPDVNFKASGAALAVSVIVGIPAMITIGIPGAALAYFLSALVEHLVKWYVLRRLPVASPVDSNQ